MLLEDVEADELDVQQDGRWIALWRAHLVVGQPRALVQRPLTTREAEVERLCGDGATSGEGR
jgi:hypothetical protein